MNNTTEYEIPPPPPLPTKISPSAFKPLHEDLIKSLMSTHVYDHYSNLMSPSLIKKGDKLLKGEGKDTRDIIMCLKNAENSAQIMEAIRQYIYQNIMTIQHRTGKHVTVTSGGRNVSGLRGRLLDVFKKMVHLKGLMTGRLGRDVKEKDKMIIKGKDEIKVSANDLKTMYSLKKYDFCWWLQYLLTECTSDMENLDKRWVEAFAFIIKLYHIKKKKGYVIGNVKKFETEVIDILIDKLYNEKVDIAHKQIACLIIENTMNILFRYGFIPIATVSKDGEVIPMRRSDIRKYSVGFPHCSREFLKRDELARAHSVVNVPTNTNYYGWHGDTRDYNAIRSSRGILSKVDSKDFGKIRNFYKLWNPFNHGSKKNHIFYRMHQGDNCLMTSVSISPAGCIPSTFPYLNKIKSLDGHIGSLCFPKLCDMSPPHDKKLIIYTYKDKSGNVLQYSAYRPVDTIYLYLCKISAYVNTNKVQENMDKTGWPEIAVRGVPIPKIVGVIKYCRVHHEKPNKERLTAIPIVKESKFFHNVSQSAPARPLYESALEGMVTVDWMMSGPQSYEISSSPHDCLHIKSVGLRKCSIKHR